MAENAIGMRLEDRTGAWKTLEMLDLSLEKGIPLSGGASRLLFLEDEGFWVLDELPGIRRSAKHSLEYVAFDRVGAVNVDLTDAARHSDDATDRLRGLSASIAYESALIGGTTTVHLTVGELLEAVHHDDDAARLWGLIQHLIQSAVAAGVVVIVSAAAE